MSRSLLSFSSTGGGTLTGLAPLLPSPPVLLTSVEAVDHSVPPLLLLNSGIGEMVGVLVDAATENDGKRSEGGRSDKAAGGVLGLEGRAALRRFCLAVSPFDGEEESWR